VYCTLDALLAAEEIALERLELVDDTADEAVLERLDVTAEETLLLVVPDVPLIST